MGTARKTLMSLIKSQKEELPIEQSFLNDLKQVMIKLNPPRKPSKTFKPSSMNCSRNMYFQIIGAEVDPVVADPCGVRIAETGTDSHERIQYYVSKMQECGIDCEWVNVADYIDQRNQDLQNAGLPLMDTKVVGVKGFETRCYNERFNISFMCDGVIKYKGQYFILEIKTETDDKGAYRTGADEKHRKQSICYSLCLCIDRILWYYEERNYCIPKTFITEVTPQEKVEIIGLIDEVNQCVKDLVPPPKCENKRVCAYCPYKMECKKW